MSDRSSVWSGPYDDGVTQSLIAKWLNCPHRFWLYAICGAVEQQGVNIPLVYGDAFHNALEAYAFGMTPPREAAQQITQYFQRLAKAYPHETWEITRWSNICYDQFLAYCEAWQEEDVNFTSFMAEETFKEPYTLPSGRTVFIRGKFDGGVVSGKRKQSRFLAEHKIKGEVDTKNLSATLAQNFQVMFYLPPLYAKMQRESQPLPDGVLYNVIQRPLSGGKHSIRPKKGRKVKDKVTGLTEIRGAETESQFLKRLSEVYKEYPDDFFHRWKVSITPKEVERFQQESLNPILERMCDWWDSIADDPFNPWKSDNKHHYRRPFGVFDKLAKGLVGDYQGYLTKGDKSSLQKIHTVFPELE